MTAPSDRIAARRGYLTGFALALVLTLAAFAVVWTGWFGRATGLGAVALCAVAQIVVQFRYFMHLDLSASRREDLLLVLFATLLVVMMVGGSLWIMYDLNHRMM